MRMVLIRATGVVALLVAAWVSWTAGQLERRVADADDQLTTLRYGAPRGEYEAVEQSLSYIRRFPWIAEHLLPDIRYRRAVAQYWLAEYANLQPERDAAGLLIESDPQMLFLAANAAFRSSHPGASDRQAAVRELDTVLVAYRDVLKNNPQDVDAAYNYEYVARLRDLIAKNVKRQERGDDARLSADVVDVSDLPSGPTMHGVPGRQPAASNLKQFNTSVPLQQDERQQRINAGTGTQKRRKG